MTDRQRVRQDEALNASWAVVLVALCAIWGMNHVLMKWAYRDISPLLSAGVRSIIALVALAVYCRFKSIPLRSPDTPWRFGFFISLFFCLEFLFLYTGLDLTLASRGAVLFYIQPMVTALGAHFFVPNERLTPVKLLGLGLAFAGVVWVLTGRPETGQASLTGDILCLLGGASWAGINVYTKAALVGRVSFYTSLYWQLIYSIPVLLAASFILETPRLDPTWGMTGAMLFQGLAVAVFSYLVFFKLLYRFAAAGVASFTFLTPIFGVTFAGWFLGEEVPLALWGGLALVSAGVYLVNRR